MSSVIPLALGQAEIITFPGERTMLVCPGDTVHYSCSTPLSTITWSLKCIKPQTTPFTPGVGADAWRCGDVNFNLIVSYASSDGRAWSNMSISVLAIDYSRNRFNGVSIDCENSGEFKYLNVTGDLYRHMFVS